MLKKNMLNLKKIILKFLIHILKDFNKTHHLKTKMRLLYLIHLTFFKILN